MAIACDIRNPEAIAQALDKIESEWELPSVVVNNAAGNFISPTERLSANAFKTVVDIVLNGTAFLTLEAGKRMIKQEKGNATLHTRVSWGELFDWKILFNFFYIFGYPGTKHDVRSVSSSYESYLF